MGPSAFTDDSRRDFMLETERDAAVAPHLTCKHAMTEMVELIDTYFAAVR